MGAGSLARPLVGIAGVWHISRWLHRLWLRSQFDGLDSLVSFSSRIIAAMRAMESERPNALFHDPLAEVLAGRVAMKNARNRPRQDRHILWGNRFPIRVRYFDDALLEALGVLDPSGFSPPWKATPRPESGAMPRQVVMLGAGMDTRAWRLPLPPRTHWFEVDRGDVLEAKRRTLAHAGAAVGPTRWELDEAKDGDRRSPEGPPPRWPLKAASITSVACDLSRPDWKDQLLAAGFDPAVPSVFLAEGLLMYLERHDAEQVLKTARELAAPGSVFLINTISRPHRPAGGQADGNRGQVDAGWGGGPGDTAAKRDVEGRRGLRRLREEWKWLCEPDPTAELQDMGWRTITMLWRGHPQMSYGRIPPEEQLPDLPVNAPDARFGNSLYIRAVPA